MSEHMIYLLKAAFLGLIEGLTEFIPVSSTAHLLIIGEWIGFSSGSAKVFEVVIQLGSILAVVWIFRQRLWQLIHGTFTGNRTEMMFTRNLIIAFLPAAVVGALMISYVKMIFGHPFMFVIMLILGGLLMLWVERKPQFAKELPDQSVPRDNSMATLKATAHSLEDITWKQALVVGFAQCVAMIPGTSRSGATIISGMMAGIQRKTATEFSFFLAMPTMLAASAYDLYRHGDMLSSEQTGAIIVGFIVAFLSALVVVRAVLNFVARHTYRPFAWYRIIFGFVIMAWLLLR